MSENRRAQLLQELAGSLLDPDCADNVRANARRALGRMSDEGTLLLLVQGAMESDSPRVVIDVLDVLGLRRRLGDLELAVVAFLYDSSEQIRQRALTLLGDRGSARMRGILEGVVEAVGIEDSLLGEPELELANRALEELDARSEG
jgi:HEAT repeat protein